MKLTKKLLEELGWKQEVDPVFGKTWNYLNTNILEKNIKKYTLKGCVEFMLLETKLETRDKIMTCINNLPYTQI
jgi:hypothetical protein